MKKTFLILIAGLIIFGCGGQKKEDKPLESQNKFNFDTTDIKAVPVSNQNQLYYLRYKLQKGKVYNFRVTALSKDDQTVSNKDTTMSQTMEQTMIYNLGFDVTDIDADSTMEMKTTISSIKVDGSAGDQKIHYQSGLTKDTAEIHKYAEYESLIQNPFTVRISKLGEMLDIYRVEGVVNKLLKIRGYSDSLKSEEKTALKNDITESVLKPLLSQVFRKVPVNKVSKDSTWKIEQSASSLMVFQVENTSTFTITGVQNLNGDIIADIQGGLNTKITGKNKLTQQGVNYEFTKPETSGGGKIYFNITKGLLQKTKTSSFIKLGVSMESKGQTGNKKEAITNTNILEYLP